VKTDQPLKAILIGSVTAGPIFEGFSQLMKALHLTDLSALEVMSLMWVKEPSWLLGILAAVGINFWVILITYYSVKIWGVDHFPLKAMAIAMTAESLVFSIYGILGKNERIIQDIAGNYVHAAAAGLAGFVSGYVIKRFLFDERKSSH
jgi:hypothetical protein